jgi:hypothetical protein
MQFRGQPKEESPRIRSLRLCALGFAPCQVVVDRVTERRLELFKGSTPERHDVPETIDFSVEEPGLRVQFDPSGVASVFNHLLHGSLIPASMRRRLTDLTSGFDAVSAG